MKKIILFFMGITIIMFADKVKIFNKDLFNHYLQWETKKVLKKEVLRLDNNITVFNCIQYLKEIQNHNILEIKYNYYTLSQYLNCLPAKEFQKKDYKVEYLKKSDIDYSQVILNHLDLNLFRSSLHQQIRYEEKTKQVVLITDLLGKPKTKTNIKLFFVDDEEWEYTFEVIAISKSKDKQEIYFTFRDEAKKSSYIGFSLLKLINYKNKNKNFDLIEL